MACPKFEFCFHDPEESVMLGRGTCELLALLRKTMIYTTSMWEDAAPLKLGLTNSCE